MNDFSVPQVNRIITPKFSTCTILAYAPLPIVSETFYYIFNTYYYPILYSEINRYYLFTCGSQRQHQFQILVNFWKGLAFALSTMLSYALLLLGTVVFLMIFKRSILKRKSLTTRKKQKNSARETKLMLNVLVVCVIYLITAAPRTINKMSEYFGFAFRNYKNTFLIESVLGYFQALNHIFNIFVYLGINTKFRKTFCDIFMLKRTSKTK